MKYPIFITAFLFIQLSLSSTATPLLSHLNRIFAVNRPKNTMPRRRSKLPFVSMSRRRRIGSKHECFPASALVSLPHKRIPIENLVVGHNVSTGTDRWSSVYAFTHADRSIVSNFIAMKTVVGTLIASPGHHIYDARGFITAARNVKPGKSYLQSSTNGSVIVQCVTTIRARGLYNPQTLDSRLVVNGFLVSTYTDAVDESVSQSLLAPLRASFTLTKSDFSAGYIASPGIVRSTLLALFNILAS